MIDLCCEYLSVRCIVRIRAIFSLKRAVRLSESSLVQENYVQDSTLAFVIRLL